MPSSPIITVYCTNIFSICNLWATFRLLHLVCVLVSHITINVVIRTRSDAIRQWLEAISLIKTRQFEMHYSQCSSISNYPTTRYLTIPLLFNFRIVLRLRAWINVSPFSLTNDISNILEYALYLRFAHRLIRSLENFITKLR